MSLCNKSLTLEFVAGTDTLYAQQLQQVNKAVVPVLCAERLYPVPAWCQHVCND